jgi:outer membrane protein OmpA-like peptidoglycan-associated protein
VSAPAPQAAARQTTAPASVPAAKSDAPIALDGPTPPPSVSAPVPVPDIPPMQIVGPQASATPPTAPTTPTAPTQPAPIVVQPKSAQTSATTAPAIAKSTPTPPPAVSAAPTADTVSPPPATKAPAAAPQQQLASLPPAKSNGAKGAPPASAESLEIRFAAGIADLDDTSKASLDKLVDNLKGDEKSRLQLLAYASEDQASPSKARRLSLSRALAVRSYLISKSIRSTRIDVRALGDQVPSGAPDRVDLKVTDR